MTIEEYYNDFRQDLSGSAGANKDYFSGVFVDKICEIISEQGIMPDAERVDYKSSLHRGIAVDAWSRDAERGYLTLLLADFRNSEIIETITNSEIEKNFNKLDRFVDACGNPKFVQGLEDSDPVVPLARYIWEQRKDIRAIDYVILTDAQISSRVKELQPVGKHVRKCEIWDIQRMYELETPGREAIEVDFTEYQKDGIECLCASTGEASLQSYLFVLSGQILANLYDRYGERLFEQNVRTFLQFRGKVNKGIRNTIVQQPSMFFAYNNGLSATGESIETTKNSSRILKITNLQIVNGGQTTASIYTAWRNEKADLQDIFVQVKLSIVDGEKVGEIVPRISEYANTQNKVSAADFFSNHPFHVRVEEHSRRVWAPAVDGELRQTHWFYERARGQYINAQAKLSKAACSKFVTQNPKHQMFTKTDLAKYILSFWKMPHLVSRGAQKAFAGASGSEGFVSMIIKEWERNCDRDGNNTTINELWFKESVAKAIFFKSLDKALTNVVKAKNFGSYKAQIVTYTLAKFALMVETSDRFINYEKIWNLQKVPADVLAELVRIAEAVTDFFMGQQTHIGELAKKEICWQTIQKVPMELSPSVEDIFRHKEEQVYVERQAQRDQRIINDIQAQVAIVSKGDGYWQRLREWNESRQILSSYEQSALNIACQISLGRSPNEAQAKALIAAEKRAVNDGFYVL